MGNPTLEVGNFLFADNDNADPDDCTFDVENESRVGVAKSVTFMVRIQVAETAGNDATNKNWQLYYNTSDTAATASAVLTAGSGGTTIITANGSPTQDDPCDVQRGSDPGGTWMDGIYSDGDETAKYTLTGTTTHSCERSSRMTSSRVRSSACME
jgi:hypothetical protein